MFGYYFQVPTYLLNIHKIKMIKAFIISNLLNYPYQKLYFFFNTKLYRYLDRYINTNANQYNT